jgi:hypothetical protein
VATGPCQNTKKYWLLVNMWLMDTGTSSLQTSVADPDPYVFGPPGSGSFYSTI